MKCKKLRFITGQSKCYNGPHQTEALQIYNYVIVYQQTQH